MADTIDLTLRADQSPVPNALNVYFSFVVDLLKPSTTHLALNSTLVTFDIDAKAPLYNEEVFRSFADRLITTSPTDFGMGSANFTDTFSYNYIEMLRRLLAVIDTSLNSSDLDKIQVETNNIKASQKSIRELLADVAKAWETEAKANGYQPTDKDYLDKKIAFYNLQGIQDQLKGYKSDIADSNERIAKIRDSAYPDDEARAISLYHRYATASEYEMIRPQSPTLEADQGYDQIKLAQAWIYGNIGGVFDEGVDLRPSGTLASFLTNSGTRGFDLATGTTFTHNHDDEWHVHASGGWMFFSASVDRAQENHIRHSISKTRTLHVGFSSIAEYWVKRGRWYSSDVFKMKRVKDFLKANPQYSINLGYVVSSVLIGRGLSVSLKFSDQDSLTEWSASHVDAGGGISLLGINFGVPGSYHNSNADYSQTINTADQSVTFADGDQHCRLLAFRVEKVVPDEVISPQMLAAEVNYLEDSYLGREYLKSVQSTDRASVVIDNDHFRKVIGSRNK